jgi:hypothetical protein
MTARSTDEGIATWWGRREGGREGGRSGGEGGGGVEGKEEV